MSVQTASDHQQFNIGVKALIAKDGRLLFLKRRDFPVWELPGGRINEGEAIHDTLKRELAEELPGLKRCSVHEIVHAQLADHKLPNGNSLMLLFFRVAASLPEIVHSSDEHEDVCWASADEVTTLNTRTSFKEAAQALLGVPTS